MFNSCSYVASSAPSPQLLFRLEAVLIREAPLQSEGNMTFTEYLTDGLGLINILEYLIAH